MKYLLDVNALLAYLIEAHVHHTRARRWVLGLTAKDTILIAPWVEIGCLRVGLQTRHLESREMGLELLAGMAAGKAVVVFIPDDSRAADLPGWATSPARLSDGHLFALAARHGAALATFDQGIPGAGLIP